MAEKLTNKQALFVKEYLKDLNATQAAIRAGYSKKTANVIGPENLSKPYIQKVISEAMQKRSERTQVDADWILKHCSEMLEADIGDILDDVGAIKPIKDWPKIWRQMLNGMDVKELFDFESCPDSDGKIKIDIGQLKKIKFVAREKILELTGKHIDVSAFQERVEHSGSINSFAAGLNAIDKTLESNPDLKDQLTDDLVDKWPKPNLQPWPESIFGYSQNLLQHMFAHPTWNLFLKK